MDKASRFARFREGGRRQSVHVCRLGQKNEIGVQFSTTITENNSQKEF